MDLTHLVIQGVITLACAGIAAFLLPRRIPGKLVGLALIGLVGVWLGEAMVTFVNRTYRFSMPGFVTWDVHGVAILPAIVGSAVILYAVTTLLSWGRYQR